MSYLTDIELYLTTHDIQYIDLQRGFSIGSKSTVNSYAVILLKVKKLKREILIAGTRHTRTAEITAHQMSRSDGHLGIVTIVQLSTHDEDNPQADKKESICEDGEIFCVRNNA
jgi:hypothetical protein